MYNVVLPLIATTVSLTEKAVPPPQLVKFGPQRVYRFVERLPQQAILLKLARVATGIQSCWLVLSAGYTQEAAALQRIVDELCSDITFLTAPLVGLPREPSHDQYLRDFFAEEYTDPSDVVGTAQKRDRVPRRKIRAYLARELNKDEPVSEVVATSEALENAYSGFVHGAGVHTMDTYFGSPPSFHVDGSTDSPFLDDHFEDFRNYLHRALLAAASAAKSVGHDERCSALLATSNALAVQYKLWPDTKL